MHGVAQFMDPTSVVFLKLVLAIVLGGLIGTERAILARQSAGTRTFGLVALGSALFVVIGNYVNVSFLGLADVQPTYIASGIITGIGFLGAGLIVFRGDTLHGVTTAAGLWITTAIGMAVGYGLYAIAIFSTLLTLTMFTGMWYVENRFKHWFVEHNHDTRPPLSS